MCHISTSHRECTPWKLSWLPSPLTYLHTHKSECVDNYELHASGKGVSAPPNWGVLLESVNKTWKRAQALSVEPRWWGADARACIRNQTNCKVHWISWVCILENPFSLFNAALTELTECSDKGNSKIKLIYIFSRPSKKLGGAKIQFLRESLV